MAISFRVSGSVACLISIWIVWQEKNTRIFLRQMEDLEDCLRLDLLLFLFLGLYYHSFWGYSYKCFTTWLVLVMQSKRLHGELLPIWILPPMGSFKLNFDECALGNLAQLAIASVIRDHSHTVLAAFPKPADERASTPRQGFWLLFREFTISQGFFISLTYGWNKIMLFVISWLSKSERGPWKYAGWLHQILDAASNLGCAFSSSPHFANHAAGQLAKVGAKFLFLGIFDPLKKSRVSLTCATCSCYIFEMYACLIIFNKFILPILLISFCTFWKNFLSLFCT